MLDTLTSKNHTDFKQRYQGTFGFLLQNDKKFLVQVTSVDKDEARFVDVKKNEYYVYADGEHMFEFIPLQRGWFNTKTNLYYAARHPARQWHRGICESNTFLSQLNGMGSFTVVSITLKVLSEIFEHPISHIEAYKAFLDGGRAGCAISRHFALALGKFYFDNKIVGDYTKESGGITITLSNDLIRQEVTDTIRRNGYPNLSLKEKEPSV